MTSKLDFIDKTDFVKSNREKLKLLHDLLLDKKHENTYNRWIKNGFPSKQSRGKDGELYKFFKDNFGLKYGDEEKFKLIDEVLDDLNERGEFNKERPNIPKLDLSKITHKEKNEPKPEKQEDIDIERQKILVFSNPENYLFSKDEKGNYLYPKVIKKMYKAYISSMKDKILTQTEIQFLDNHKRELAEALFEMKEKKGAYLIPNLEKVREYNKKLQELEYMIDFPKTELEKKKAMKMKKELVKKIKELKFEDFYSELTDGEKPLKINEANDNTYIPNKFIPLYIKDKNGPGYHRISGEEVKALKNDQSGDYYDGTGRRNKINSTYNVFNQNGFTMDNNGYFHSK